MAIASYPLVSTPSPFMVALILWQRYYVVGREGSRPSQESFRSAKGLFCLQARLLQRAHQFHQIQSIHCCWPGLVFLLQ
jgi:hypothetical protein